MLVALMTKDAYVFYCQYQKSYHLYKGKEEFLDGSWFTPHTSSQLGH